MGGEVRNRRSGYSGIDFPFQTLSELFIIKNNGAGGGLCDAACVHGDRDDGRGFRIGIVDRNDIDQGHIGPCWKTELPIQRLVSYPIRGWVLDGVGRLQGPVAGGGAVNSVWSVNRPRSLWQCRNQSPWALACRRGASPECSRA